MSKTVRYIIGALVTSATLYDLITISINYFYNRSFKILLKYKAENKKYLNNNEITLYRTKRRRFGFNIR
jgi:hypothetical protein